jgi:hypothetical protein
VKDLDRRYVADQHAPGAVNRSHAALTEPDFEQILMIERPPEPGVRRFIRSRYGSDSFSDGQFYWRHGRLLSGLQLKAAL